MDKIFFFILYLIGFCNLIIGVIIIYTVKSVVDIQKDLLDIQQFILKLIKMSNNNE